MTYKQALNFEQKWTAKQAFNDLERYLLRGEKPAMKAVSIGMQALEKQIPKKPEKDETAENVFYCPNCKNWWRRWKNDYCHHCGQALDWSEEIE